MKKTLVIALLALSSAAAFAGNWSYIQNGNLGWYQGNDGSSYTTNRFGNTTYWNGFDSNGQYHFGSIIRNGNNIYGFGD